VNPSLGPIGNLVARFATPLFVAACLPVWFALVGAGVPMLGASLCLLAMMVTLTISLERWLPNRRLQARPAGSWHVILFYNGFVSPAVAVALPSLVLVPTARWLGDRLGTTSLWPQTSLAMDLWLVIILTDFTSYWWHRAEHTLVAWSLPWRLHSVHHAPRFYDFWMGAQVHPVDVVVFGLVGFTLLAALGAPLVALEAGACFAAIIGGIHHLGAETRGGVLNWLIPFADHHAVHHSVRPDENGNYGNITTLFDQLFGSYVEPRPGDESPIGAFSLADGYPDLDLGVQLRSPFSARLWARLSRPKPTTPQPPPRPASLPDRGWRRVWAVAWLVGITAALAATT